MPTSTQDLNRRHFLKQAGATLGAASIVPAALASDKLPANLTDASWQQVREQFPLQPGLTHMAGFLLTSHPKPVADAIAHYRTLLDSNPAGVLMQQEHDLEQATLNAAGEYLNDKASNVALVESTTAGLAALYGGLSIKAGQEILTTEHDHYVTFTCLDQTVKRTGAKLNRISLYDTPNTADKQQIVSRIKKGITPKTRVVAITWVHSGTGVKLPIAEIASVVKDKNRGRSEEDRILFCVDGVHGFGIDNIDIQTMGCDFFVAGTHKWMFGPRGTGILWGKDNAWQHVEPIIPTFDRNAFLMWMQYLPEGPLPGAIAMTPGGTHAFEHRWALADAFRFHRAIGKARIEQRIHDLNRQLKQGLLDIPGVTVHTPVDSELSAGIIAFELDKLNVLETVTALGQQGIVATMSPYRQSYPRFAPGLINSSADIERCLEAIKGLA